MNEEYQHYFDQHGIKEAGREAAIQAFTQLGIPTTRQEDWRYTDFKGLRGNVFPVAMRKTAVDLSTLNLPESQATRLVFVDGFYQEKQSDTLPQGVHIASNITRAEGSDFTDGLVALNSALCTCGIEISLQQSLAQPLHLIFISATSSSGSYTALQVHLGEGVEAEVVEVHMSLTDVRSFVNHASDVVLAKHAKLSLYSLQYLQPSMLYRHHMTVAQHEKSHFASHAIGLGAAMARTDIHIDMLGEDAHCTLNGLYLTQARQHMDYHTTVHHRVPNCESHEYYKGVLMGRSRAVFNGKVIVYPQAQKTEAHQQNKNLLLSRNAEIDTKPELEIYADDVKCSHGATVGQIDPNQMFYLNSRGLNADQAQQLLTFSFAAELLNHMDDPVLQQHARQKLLAVLPGDTLSSELQAMSL